MKALRNLFATIVTTAMSLPYMVFAQNEGTYIDNLGVQDSAYMEQDLMADGAQGTGTVSIILYVVILLIIIGAVVYFLKRKKKQA